MGSQHAVRNTSQAAGAAPRPDAVPLRSGAFPGGAVTRLRTRSRGSGWQRTKRQSPGPRRARDRRPCPLPPAGGSRGPGPRSQREGGSSPRSGSVRTAAPPGRAGRLRALSGRAAPCERLPEEQPAAGHPPASPGTHRAVPGEGLQSGAGMLRTGRRCRCCGRDCFKFISSSVLEAKPASLFRFELSL